VSEMDRMTPAAVQERYGLSPSQYPDFAALRGDPSDNLPKIPGVGEKTAAKWIREYGTLASLVDRVDEVGGKVGDALRAHLPQVLTNRQLTELVRDVPVPLGEADLRRHSWDREEVHQLFDTLQFRVLRDRLYQTLETPTPEAEAGVDTVVVQLGAGEVGAWLDEHLPAAKASAPLATGVEVAGTWGRGTGRVDVVALATPDGHGGWVDVVEATAADLSALAAFLGDPERPKVMHDAKGPLHALTAAGMPLAGLRADTALTAFLVLPGQRSYDLADLVLRFLHKELSNPEQGTTQTQLSLDGSAEDERHTEDVLRAAAVLELADALNEELSRRGGAQLLHDVELPLVHLLQLMESTGVAADVDLLAQLEDEFAAEVDRAAHDAYDAIGHEVNLGSPKQLQGVLFDELAMPKTKRTKTGYTTDADALADLFAKTEHPFLEALLRHRDAVKLRVTVEGLIGSVDDDGRIRTTFNQTIAATGRLSSTDPNLQNIPIRTVAGRRIRAAFVVGEPMVALLTADYSQIEMRIMAHLSEDERLIEALSSGTDFHAQTAASVFGVAAEEVSGEQRAKIKAMNYGLAYGLSAFGLSRQLNIEVGEAQGLMEEYFTIFGGVRDYLGEVVERARVSGYTETLMGRRRYLPDLTSDNRQRRQMAERMALNAPIQGSAADIVKVAMLRVHEALTTASLSSRILLQVHDELVLEVAPGEEDAVRDLVVQRMSDAASLRVPLAVSVGLGRSWFEAAH
jgi:DNA polymerase-1